MALPFPYVFYACSCADPTGSIDIHDHTYPRGHSGYNNADSANPLEADEEDDAEAESRPLDLWSRQANYSLYPLEYLLYCVDCNEMRCPRCTREEVNNWFCPSCLLEVAGNRVKGDQHRCAQNCFVCPICTSKLSLTSVSSNPPGPSGSAAPSSAPQYYLGCSYCHWTTLEIGVRFDKPVNIGSQLARKQNRHGISLKQKLDMLSVSGSGSGSASALGIGPNSPSSPLTATSVSGLSSASIPSTSGQDPFDSTLAFYREQLKNSVESGGIHGGGIADFGSPSALSRLISYYSTPRTQKNRDTKPALIREARTPAEGLRVFDGEAERKLIDQIRTRGWDGTATRAQREAQPRPDVRFVQDLWPVPPLLRTKRAKRCRRCRQILLKPEPKITSARCKIKLLALNHIPKLLFTPLTLLPPSTPSTPLQSSASTPTSSSRPLSISSAPLQIFNTSSGGPFVLRPNVPAHFVLTVSNPLDDPITVHLAAPSSLSGFKGSRVTIMRPQFEVGANADAWDDVLEPGIGPLGGGGAGAGSSRSGGHSAPGSAFGATFPNSGAGSYGAASGSIMAGEIWDRGRNWTSVVVELTVGYPDLSRPLSSTSPSSSNAQTGSSNSPPSSEKPDAEASAFASSLANLSLSSSSFGPDRLIVEIPIFVRTEYECTVDENEDDGPGGSAAGLGVSEAAGGDGGIGGRLSSLLRAATKSEPTPRPEEAADGKIKLEQGFWTVVGAGKLEF